ncbi:MAG: threonine-phosphate decarboxylase CobD [bacterium]
MVNHSHGGNIEAAVREFALSGSEIIDFSANINPLGYPPQLPEIIKSNIGRIIHYPDPKALALREKLGERFSLDPRTILVGNGSTELIYLMPRALKPKSAGLIVPTYSDYERALRQVETAIAFIGTKEEDDFTLNTLEFAPGTEMVFLGNPNNPTGTLLEKDFLLEVIHCNPGTIFVVDEAFIDFLPRPEEYSLIKEAVELANLVVLRSMTKFFALPGLRLGYLVSSSKIVESLEKYQEPWTINTLAQAAGEHIIFEDEYIRRSRDFISTEKDFFYQALAQIGPFYPFKPSVNFILVRMAEGRWWNKKSKIQGADQLRKVLIKEGFLIRDCSSFRGLDRRFFRLAVRTRQENRGIVSALRRIAHRSKYSSYNGPKHRTVC